jgi:hypothetical protein
MKRVLRPLRRCVLLESISTVQRDGDVEVMWKELERLFQKEESIVSMGCMFVLELV